MVFNSKGQSLIEMLVAMSAAIVVVSAITVAVISALSNAQFGKNQNLASQYAQEGMEVVRKIRDTDWNSFGNLAGSYCLDKGGVTLNSINAAPAGGCSQNIDNIFVREIEIEKDSDSCNSNGTAQTKVSVFVKWSDGKCGVAPNNFCHQASLVSCFTDANLVPTPGENN